MEYIQGTTEGNIWLAAMKVVMQKGKDIWDEDIPLREVQNLYLTIDKIDEKDPILEKYADKDRIALMKEKYSTCGLVGDYKIDYGSYIYDNNGINQIDWIIKRIKKKPETKSATITLHKPGEDMLACLSMLDFKYRENMLDMTVIYRSQNIFWSHPGNMLALHHIHQDVANALGYPLGKIELIVISAHIYASDFDKVNIILSDIERSNL